MKLLLIAMFISLLFMPNSGPAAPAEDLSLRLNTLKNYQVNTPAMVSSGLPNRGHFEALKSNGVANVIDLLPGDRREEINLMQAVGLNYKNIEVQWGNPTLENFDDYVVAMQRFELSGGATLTHCQLNWRGAVFTYLYRITQLREAEHIARQDMDAIWKANDVWLKFIEQVKSKYL
jgi:protein tyrosine phosphatase (PTP) superfamily phosphohydrolase (DUF442 family)|tara:strand:+ start:436 stop:963 length:528 start_codon:yes stop_codon:yes gene_type:complete